MSSTGKVVRQTGLGVGVGAEWACGCAGRVIAGDRSGGSGVVAVLDVQVAADDPLRGTLSMLPGPLGWSSSHRRRFSLQLTASSKA